MHFEEKDDRHGGAAGGQAVVGNSTLEREADLIALGSRLSALGSRLSALGSRLSALGSRLSALGSRLSALGSRLSALGSRLSALGSRLSALGSRLSALMMLSPDRIAFVKPFFEVFITFSPSAPLRPGNRTRKATAPIVLNVIPCRFQKRPMKPAYRASSRCRKTLTAEIQSGTSNVSTSDPSPLPYSLSAPQPARKTQRICPMEQSNLAKRAAPSSVRLLAHLPEKKDAHRHDRGGDRDAPARCDRQTGQIHGQAARPAVAGAEGWTYAAGDGIEVTVTFSETVKVE